MRMKLLSITLKTDMLNTTVIMISQLRKYHTRHKRKQAEYHTLQNIIRDDHKFPDEEDHHQGSDMAL